MKGTENKKFSYCVTVSLSLQKNIMKHKRHQKDKRDKDERGGNNARYHSEISTIYTMKDISPDHNDDSNQPKKLIIYIVILSLLKVYN